MLRWNFLFHFLLFLIIQELHHIPRLTPGLSFPQEPRAGPSFPAEASPGLRRRAGSPPWIREQLGIQGISSHGADWKLLKSGMAMQSWMKGMCKQMFPVAELYPVFPGASTIPSAHSCILWHNPSLKFPAKRPKLPLSHLFRANSSLATSKDPWQ